MSLVQNISYANPTTPMFGPSPAYGSFSSSQTQGIPIGVASPATYNTVDIVPVGVSLVSPGLGSVIRIGVPGVYKCLASVQCDRTAAGVGDLEMFPQIGAAPVPNSTTRVQINQNQEVVMTVEWLLTFNTGDLFNVFFFSSSAGQQLLAIPATVSVPAIPSIILTLVKIA